MYRYGNVRHMSNIVIIIHVKVKYLMPSAQESSFINQYKAINQNTTWTSKWIVKKSL